MSKPRIIIWFVSNDGRFIGNALNILAAQFKGIEVVGVTATKKISVNNFQFIPLNEISVNGGGYDILLVAGAKNLGMAEVVKFAKAIKLDTEKLLGDWIVCIPGFTLQKYRQLQRSRLSIFSQNCFGGMLSHLLGLPFRSPFVNLWIPDNNFVKLLSHPRVYMEEKVIYRDDDWEPNLKVYYPVGLIGDVRISFNHYKNFDEAVAKWEERKQKINWYNLIVIGVANNLDLLKKFDELPQGKKICFVNFESTYDSAFYINPKFMQKRDIHAAIFDISRGDLFYYDVFDMLLYGKKTPLINM